MKKQILMGLALITSLIQSQDAFSMDNHPEGEGYVSARSVARGAGLPPAAAAAREAALAAAAAPARATGLGGLRPADEDMFEQFRADLMRRGAHYLCQENCDHWAFSEEGADASAGSPPAAGPAELQRAFTDSHHTRRPRADS